MAVCSVAQFDRLWDDAQREASPDPKVAAGALMKTFAEALGVELIAFGKTGPAALFLFDLSKLGFKGMDMSRLIARFQIGGKTPSRRRKAYWTPLTAAPAGCDIVEPLRSAPT